MKKEILEYLEQTRNPFEIHRATGYRLSDIRSLMRDNPTDLPGWGRPELQHHIISLRVSQNPGHGFQ